MAAEKLIRDRLEERVLAGDVRTEADPARLSALLDARLDEDLAELRAAEHPEAADYATLVELLLARAARQGISQEQIEAARLARLQERGGFERGLVWTPPDPVFSIAHEVPPRLRFIGASLKNSPGTCQAICTIVTRLPCVQSAEANPITGSLIVCYDSAPGVRREIIRALEAFSRAPVQGEAARPILLARGGTSRIERALEAVAEEAVEEAIQLAAASVL